jgi:hypothetical protein
MRGGAATGEKCYQVDDDTQQLSMACKRNACGHVSFLSIMTAIFFISGKLDLFSKINPYIAAP